MIFSNCFVYKNSIFGKWDCKDVTVGDCSINWDDVIDEIDTALDFEQCQESCFETHDCAIFRFDGENCILFRKDYREDCHVIGGPFNQSFDGCFDGEPLENCNLLFQEDCVYEGNSFVLTPNGTIVDPKTCEELCFEYHDLECEYWVYNKTLETCNLFDSNAKNCQTWGGPSAPSFSSCNENCLDNDIKKTVSSLMEMEYK